MGFLEQPCDSANSEESSSSMAYLSVESQMTYCRVCWDTDATNLISPCSCKGTQKFVHVKCLRRWQENVQKRDVRDERAFRCGVCQTPYSLAPPNDPRWTSRVSQILRGFAGALCISLLTLGLAGPPWPHLALLALVLLGTRSHGLIALVLLAAGTVLAILHVRGLRLLMRVDDGRIGLAVIRHSSSPVPGLKAGTLLVASEELEHSIFGRSVVLIYEHGPEGAKGVILNQPMGHVAIDNAGGIIGAALAAEQNATASAAAKPAVGGGGATAVQHRLGGPVGLPGEGARQEIAVLHSIRGIEGSYAVLQGQGNVPTLFQGGRLVDVLESFRANPPCSTAGSGRKCSTAKADSGSAAVLVFHGISVWAEGQLEGEIRARSWAYGDAVLEDVFSTAPEDHWEALMGSARLTVLN